jgi:hypothetical protein
MLAARSAGLRHLAVPGLRHLTPQVKRCMLLRQAPTTRCNAAGATSQAKLHSLTSTRQARHSQRRDACDLLLLGHVRGARAVSC